MKPVFMLAVPVTLTLLAAPAAQAQQSLTDRNIDVVTNALSHEPSFKDGGGEAKLGYWFIRLFKVDWPIKDADLRATWDLDPKQDTDGDGIFDIDDDDLDGDGLKNYQDPDIDGDGVPNLEDGSPYDSAQQIMLPDRDGDGIPDDIDPRPRDPGGPWATEEMNNLHDRMLSKAMWRMQN